MGYQSFGRTQRPKGANIKQALKVMLVLAVCAWLVYQTKHSIWNKIENYGVQTKLDVGDATTMHLGRKGTPSRFDGRAFPNSGNEDSSAEGQELSSGSDDVFDEAKKLDKAEEEFGHVNEKLRGNEEKDVELEPEKQSKVSSKNKYKDSSEEKSGKVYVESRRSDSGDKEHGKYPQSYDKETAIQLREPQNDVQVTKNAKSDFSRKENNEEIATNAGVTEGIDEVQTFHDETGVPPDCNETEIMVGETHIVHEESISDFSKGSSIGKGNIFEVTSGEENNVEVTLEGTKNGATADEEINTATITHVDASGINLNSDISQGDSIVL